MSTVLKVLSLGNKNWFVPPMQQRDVVNVKMVGVLATGVQMKTLDVKMSSCGKPMGKDKNKHCALLYKS